MVLRGCINADQVVSREHEIDGTEERTESACYFHVKMSQRRNFYLQKGAFYRELSKKCSFLREKKGKCLEKRDFEIRVCPFRLGGIEGKQESPSNGALLLVSISFALVLSPRDQSGCRLLSGLLRRSFRIFKVACTMFRVDDLRRKLEGWPGHNGPAGWNGVAGLNSLPCTMPLIANTLCITITARATGN